MEDRHRAQRSGERVAHLLIVAPENWVPPPLHPEAAEAGTGRKARLPFEELLNENSRTGGLGK